MTINISSENLIVSNRSSGTLHPFSSFVAKLCCMRVSSERVLEKPGSKKRVFSFSLLLMKPVVRFSFFILFGGMLILLSACNRGEPEEEGCKEIWADIEFGGENSIITEGDYCPGSCGSIEFYRIDKEPAWSPDGEWIAYFHADILFCKTGIYLIRPDGSENKLWHQGFGENLTWSPDGQWIAFSEGARIWKKKLNGESLTQLTFEGRNFFPVWGPEDRIFYTHSVCNEIACGVWSLDLNNKEKTFEVLYGMFPAYNPTTDKVLYKRTWNEVKDDKYAFQRGDSLYYYDYQLKESVALIALEDPMWDNTYFRINKAGTKIVFESRPENDAQFRIWSINSDGTNLKKLTDYQSTTADWSPDGSKIVYNDARKSSGRLWIMDADGSNKTQLTFEHHFEDK